MRLSALGEFGLIHTIQSLSPRTAPGVVIGIGDDAAGLSLSPHMLLLATTDMLIEGVHFDRSYTDFYSLGWKSAAANVSDIAAMGGLPRFCLTALGIPPSIPVERISEFYHGLNALFAAHKTVLVGGDTCSSRTGLTISITLLGEARRNNVVTRAGAQPGDRIFVTNTLGDSAAGLEILKAGSRVRGQGSRSSGQGAGGRGVKTLIEKHLRPVPRVEWGGKIALAGCASAMIDVSDGLSSDLGHICEQSKIGAIVYSKAIPLSDALKKSADRLRKPLLSYALSGGEDYELLFTVPPAKTKKLRSLDIPVTEIGEITRARDLFILDDKNKSKRLKPTGYNHFSGGMS